MYSTASAPNPARSIRMRSSLRPRRSEAFGCCCEGCDRRHADNGGELCYSTVVDHLHAPEPLGFVLMDARKALLVDAYRRFNGRDVDGLLSMMTDDVEWPDVPNQAVLRSKDAIRQYWLGEFAVTDPQMVPTEFVPGAAEDEIVAVVEQEVRDLSGAVLVDRREMRHRYSFRDGWFGGWLWSTSSSGVRPVAGCFE